MQFFADLADNVSLFAYGAMFHTALEATEQAAEKGISAEVIDLRTLMPFDKEAVLNSVAKTGRVVIVHEAPKTCGFGAEIAATIAEEALEYLKAPIVRVAGFDTPFPYALEHLYMPDANRIMSAIEKVMRFE